jgi:(R,R)-butanediol dehydrogenase/meso-butanediol dehydrogenase/diacetyl reductase
MTSNHTVAVSGRPGEVHLEERPVPEPAPGEVIVEVSHCGICGSDLHLMMEGWGGPGSVHGHEFSGVVAALGDGVEGWTVGEPVVGGPSLRCGRCEGCRSGNPSQCANRESMDVEGQDGAYAGFVRVDARTLLRVPDGLSLREAALAEPLAVALHGITRGQVRAGDTVMVFGAGPIGALSVAALVARGIGPVTVVEPGVARQELARALGADRVVHPADLPSFGIHQPDSIASDAVHVVLECSGKRPAMEAGLQQLRRGGRLVLVGAGIEPPTFDGNRILLNELTICGSFVYDEGGFEAALALLASGDLPTDLLIDPTDVPLAGLRDAMASLVEGSIAGKVMVVPGPVGRTGGGADTALTDAATEGDR